MTNQLILENIKNYKSLSDSELLQLEADINSNAASQKLHPLDYIKSIADTSSLMTYLSKVMGITASKAKYENGFATKHIQAFWEGYNSPDYNKDSIGWYRQIIDNYYNEKQFKDIDSQYIIKSERNYTNVSEGITIKKQPYSNVYTINLYRISGDIVYDKGANISEGGKQEGKIIHVSYLPTKKELHAILVLLPILAKKKIQFNDFNASDVVIENYFTSKDTINLRIDKELNL